MTNAVEVLTTSIATADVRRAASDYGELLGVVPAAGISTMGSPPIQSAFTAFRLPEGGAFSIMQSSDESGPIARFLRRRGEGLFSLTLRVADLDQCSAALRERGLQMVLPEPMVITDGVVGGLRVASGRLNFLKPCPKTHGVLFELIEF